MSYWNNTGKNQILGDQLQKLVPASGAVLNPRKNPKLEKFRKAQNCYYDLYNNGLCNRMAEFRGVYGFGASNYKRADRSYPDFSDALYRIVEELLDLIILEAAKEQKII